MTLQEIAQTAAAELHLSLTRLEEPACARLAGRGVEAEVRPFFGGWQVDLILPEQRLQYFEEDVRMLVLRVGRRIAVFEREQADASGQPGR